MIKRFVNEGDYLKRMRWDSGKTQAELGEKIGVDTQYVSNWERGLCAPPNHVYKKLAKELKLDLHRLRYMKTKDATETIYELEIFKGI